MSLFDRAARFLDDVLFLPEEVRADVERAEAALAEGRAREAEQTFRRVIEARPGLLRALVGWARALEALGDVASARVALAEARQIEPDDPQLALLAARLALHDREWAQSITLAREAARRLVVQGGAPFAEACAVRARAEWARGRPDRAARELRKAIAAKQDDVEYRLMLVEALVDADELPAALRASRGVETGALDDARATRLGLALHRAGDPGAAGPLLARAASLGNTQALEALARQSIARGELDAAEAHARMAVARGGGAAALATLADVLARSGKGLEAAHALLAAAEARRDPELMRRAARTVPLVDPVELVRFADALDRMVEPGRLSRALRTMALAIRGDRASASALLVEPFEEPRELLAAARIAHDEGRAQDALSLLDRAETDETSGPALGTEGTPEDEALARSMRRDALRALWRGTGGEVDLAAAIDGVARFAKDRDLEGALRRAEALRDELDRPLLLAILGEFNAGKSTLVNAFLGADVAPTGILPTTATLNVLRGGAERRVRVVRRDGTTREGGYADLRSLLGDAEEEGASVDHVEIVLPSELLERVWILDTPGSNAPDPAHEALAKEAMRRADAALWIFDAGQAGKATEGAILAGVRASKREVVAALNKVDRLKPAELAQVKEVLAREMPEIGGEPVTLSARAALKARLAGDDAAFEASGFPALLARLERDVFARSRQLKRRACAGRLLAVLADTLATEDGAARVHEERIAGANRAISRLASVGGGVVSDVDAAIDALEEGQSRGFEDAAREVLAFVRPRTSRFATHGADPEDRAFLAEVIENRLEQASDAAAARLATAVEARLAPALAGTELESTLGARVRGAIGAPLAAFSGYQAGLLSGGALRRFFEEVLPHAQLEVAGIAEALGVARAHPRDRLRPTLEAALAELVTSLERESRAIATAAHRSREQLRTRTYEPLRALHEVLGELVA